MARTSKTHTRQALGHESVWAIADPDLFLESAVRAIRLRNQRDVDSLPKIGRMAVTVHRLELTVEAEGLYHFFAYDRELVDEAVEYLQEIGAAKKAAILQQLAPLDVDLEDEFDAVAFQWHSTGDDSAALLQEYCRRHRQEFDDMLHYRATLPALDNTHQPSDEALWRHAYSDGPAPLNGYEQFLLEPARLPLLIRLAADAHCPCRTKAVTALYAIAGRVGADIMAAKPASVKELKDAIAEAKNLDDAGLAMWAEDAGGMLDSPAPEVLLRWMGALFN